MNMNAASQIEIMASAATISVSDNLKYHASHEMQWEVEDVGSDIWWSQPEIGARAGSWANDG